MNYEETLQYLYASTPAFHQAGAAAYKPGLENTLRLMSHLGNPHQCFRSIHVAGTNGKGSTSHILAAVLQCAGYKTGLYTSPHLVDFRERIRVNGRMIPEERVSDFVERNQCFLEEVRPSFFETTMALAFQYFAEERVDVAVVETGLGGRLDSTNIITPEASVITNIGMDHTEFLGNTLAAIASEKAGIIKEGVPVVIGEWDEETRPVFTSKAKEMHAPLYYSAESSLRLPEALLTHPLTTRLSPAYHPLITRSCGQDTTDWVDMAELRGSYQRKNIRTVLKTVEVLCGRGWKIDRKALEEGLSGVCRLTGLRGRWETVKSRNLKMNDDGSGMPTIICDTGHNSHGVRSYIDDLCRLPGLHIVFGMVQDKDVSEVLRLLPAEARYYWTQAATKRAVPAEEMQRMGVSQGLQGGAYPSVREALEAAIRDATAHDTVFIGGSNYVVGEALKELTI